MKLNEEELAVNKSERMILAGWIMACLIGITAMLAIGLLLVCLKNVADERDEAIDLGNRVVVGQTVALRSARTGRISEQIFIDHCNLEMKGEAVCDAFADWLDRRVWEGWYNYQPAEEKLYWPLTAFIAQAKQSDLDLANGWNQHDAKLWKKGIEARRLLEEFLIMLLEEQGVPPAPTPE